jgi:hypothetical protein
MAQLQANSLAPWPASVYHLTRLRPALIAEALSEQYGVIWVSPGKQEGEQGADPYIASGGYGGRGRRFRVTRDKSADDMTDPGAKG